MISIFLTSLTIVLASAIQMTNAVEVTTEVNCDNATVSSSSRTRRETSSSSCPTSEEISPCVCDSNFNTLTCIGVKDDARLAEIFQARFPLRRLSKLDIGGSDDLRSLPTNAFSRVRIREFEIHDNGIESVSGKAFAGSTTSALYINLNRNKIQRFDFGAVKSARALRQFQISHNLLTEIPDDAFGNLTYLDYVAMDNNRIRSIGANAFAGLVSLTHLDLSNNSIAILGPNSLSFSPSLLRRLSVFINSNGISAVDQGVFGTGSSPSFLTMMQNRLDTLSKDVFESLLTSMSKNPYGMNGIAVKGNSFVCDCRIKWLLANPKLLSLVFQFTCADAKSTESIMSDPKCQ